MKKTILNTLLGITLFSNTTLSAQEQLDQNHSIVSAAGSLGFNSSQGGAQSFTAGLTGALTKVMIDFNAGSSCTLTNQFTINVQILQGAGRSGTQLANQQKIITIPYTRDFLPVEFTTPANITSGQQYTVQWSAPTGQNCQDDGEGGYYQVSGNVYITTGNQYAGGAIYEGASASPTASFDIRFKTYVDPTLGNDTVFTTPINVGHVQGSNDYEIIFSDKQAVATVNVLDTLGRLVTSKSVKNSSELNFEINGNSGVYFIQLTNELNQVMSIKVVK